MVSSFCRTQSLELFTFLPGSSVQLNLISTRLSGKNSATSQLLLKDYLYINIHHSL